MESKKSSGKKPFSVIITSSEEGHPKYKVTPTLENLREAFEERFSQDNGDKCIFCMCPYLQNEFQQDPKVFAYCECTEDKWCEFGLENFIKDHMQTDPDWILVNFTCERIRDSPKPTRMRTRSQTAMLKQQLQPSTSP